MRITRKQLDYLIESLVEQALNKRFASGDPYKATQADRDIQKLSKYLNQKNVFFHFSETGKVGINPSPSNEHPGVRGFYGFKLTHNDVFETGEHAWFTKRKYIIVFKLKPSLKILELKDRNHLEDILSKAQVNFQIRKEPLKRYQTSKAEQTRLLQKMGYDGLWSGQPFFMTDIKNELVIFPPYNNKIEVVEIMKNPFHLLKQNRPYFDPKYDPSDPEPETRVPTKYKDNRSKEQNLDFEKTYNQRHRRGAPV